MNLARALWQHADSDGDKVAIYFHDQTIRYAELWQQVEAIAAGLQQAGVRGGDRVGLCMAEHPRHLATHFAVARLGAVIVPMDHRWSDAEKSAVSSGFNCRLVVDDSHELAAEVDNLPDWVDADTDVLISLSSGTTGTPKGAVLTHDNLYQRFASQWHTIGYGRDDCFAVLTPFYFGAGRSFGMSLLCAGGAVLIAPPPLQPDEIVSVLNRPGVTATFLPPTLLRRLFDLYKSGEPRLLDAIQYLVVSGEPLFPDEAHRTREIVCENIYAYYASSEGGGISVLPPDGFDNYADTVGTPTYKTEVEVVDADGNPTSAVGRLRYRGPGISTRLVDTQGADAVANDEGWFYPGDLAQWTDSGHLKLCGRDKEMIIRGGINIYPAEIEAVLLRHPDIADAAVIGVDDPAMGQQVAAFVTSQEPLAADAVIAFCREHLAPYKVPRMIHHRDDLPKRSSGKTDKAALKASLSQ